MPNREPIILCWSGGKDSSLALHALRQDDRFEVARLVTTMTEGYDRVSMHGVRRQLIEAQAESIGLPLDIVWIPPQANNSIYELRMGEVFTRLRDNAGIRTVAFGDIFLEDLRLYRENQFAALEMRCVFPLWKRNTRLLASEFCSLGFRGITSCCDPRKLDEQFVGRELDADFFASLPKDCDPCGENGEFHSFVFQSPDWQHPIEVAAGEIVQRDSFLFCDVLPLSTTQLSSTE